ncbi:unnamed protein product [Sphenostylis stenocarpa]|uniref:Uncharacterized protein n=1 Tax=Sphenostylis stenocarpa TaxID=92480 RepID=A0AA86SDS8_9FABA|nr:unnamed protein product [Sphenostylis stenocarpa]
MFEQLQKAKEAASQAPRNAKIQCVTRHLRTREHFAKHYFPKLLSFGLIHHGDPKLQLGERYKKRWAALYIDSTGKSPQELHRKVEENIETLKLLFEEDLFTDNKTFSEYQKHGFRTKWEMINWTLFVDGCALLHILEHAKLDPTQKMNLKVDQLVLVMQDVLLLENQLPFLLLNLLWRDTDKKLMKTMQEFLHCHHWATKDEDKVKLEEEFPTHLLDLQRSIILYEPKEEKNKGKHNVPNKNTGKGRKTPTEDMITYRNIKELKAAGIGFKSSKTRRPRDVSFHYGVFHSTLMLPEIVVDDTIAATVLNLIAYEMCPDFENDYGISSYVTFLDSLIDHPDDVKELRSEKILLNSLGSDEEVANLFNTLSTDLVPNMAQYADVRGDIERHYKDKGRTWVALAYTKYFSNPWAIIAFNAAIVGLVLTFVQTWYAIYPAKP